MYIHTDMEHDELSAAIQDAIAPLAGRLDRLIELMERSLPDGGGSYTVMEPTQVLVKHDGDGRFLKVKSATGRLTSLDWPVADGVQSVDGRLTRIDVIRVKAGESANREWSAMLILDVATSATTSLSINVGHVTTVAARSLIGAIASSSADVLRDPVRIAFTSAERAENAVFASISDAHGRGLAFRQSLKALPEATMNTVIAGAAYSAIAHLDSERAIAAMPDLIEVLGVPVPAKFAIVAWRLNCQLAKCKAEADVKAACGEVRTKFELSDGSAEMQVVLDLFRHYEQRVSAYHAA